MSAHFFGSPGTFSKQKVRSVNKFFIPKFSYQYSYQYFHTNIFISKIHELHPSSFYTRMCRLTFLGYLVPFESRKFALLTNFSYQNSHTNTYTNIFIPTFSFQKFMSYIHHLSIQECVGSLFWVTWYLLKAESSLF